MSESVTLEIDENDNFTTIKNQRIKETNDLIQIRTKLPLRTKVLIGVALAGFLVLVYIIRTNNEVVKIIVQGN